MTSYVSADLRRHVELRANGLCEYCLIHVSDTYLGCQVDHIISEKHGGATDAENLAYACAFCNRAKGTDVGSIVPGTDDFIRFFHPRIEQWSTHFRIDGDAIEPKTPIGLATCRILGFNTTERCLERALLRKTSRWPSQEALARIAMIA